MKKSLILTVFCLLTFAFAGYGQVSFADEGDAISVTEGTSQLQFSKSGLLIQKVNQNIVFVAGGGVYRWPFSDIDVPAYSTIDSVYTVISGWLSASYSFNGGITADSAIIDWLDGDTAIFDYLEVDTVQVNKMLQPDANDGAPIGTATVAFSDLFLASGAVVGFNNGDVTLTHSSNLLTIEGGNLTVPTLTATTITDGTQSQTAGTITGGNIWTADTLNINYITDATAIWGSSTLSGFSSISGTSLTDGSATLTGDVLTVNKVLADTVDVDTLEINSAIYPAGGGIVDLGDVTNYWNLMYSDSVLTNYINATTITDGTMTSFGGALSGVASITDGTASWNTAQQLTGFNTVSSDTLTDGTATMIGGSLDVTDITINSPVNVYSLSHNSFADYLAEQHYFQSAIDTVNTSNTGLLYATAGLLSTLDTGTLIPTATTIADMVNWSDTIPVGGVGLVTVHDIASFSGGSNWTVTGDTIEPNTATLIYTTGDVYGDTAKFLHYGGHSPFTVGVHTIADQTDDTTYFSSPVVVDSPFMMRYASGGINNYMGYGDPYADGFNSFWIGNSAASIKVTESDTAINIQATNWEGTNYGINVEAGYLSDVQVRLYTSNNQFIKILDDGLFPFMQLSTDSLDIQATDVTITGDVAVTGKVAASDSLCLPGWRIIPWLDTLCAVHGTDTIRFAPSR